MSTNTQEVRKSKTSIQFFDDNDSVPIRPKRYRYTLLNNIQNSISPPTTDGNTYLCKGNFQYFHYGCDDVNDMGWGCAYRSLQSMCSWILGRKKDSKTPVPSINEIQMSLVEIGDKPHNFIGSEKWIGSMEICFAVDYLYDVSCKILHFPTGTELMNIKDDIISYFKSTQGFIMMGGDVDSSSRGIAGIHVTDRNLYFLIVDPHCSEIPKSVQDLVQGGFVRWQSVTDFVDSSFYNLCLPQID